MPLADDDAGTNDEGEPGDRGLTALHNEDDNGDNFEDDDKLHNEIDGLERFMDNVRD
ncbi:hypothetical protein QCA50_016384 [Cerrena zonata]|uniref:Uncharacterized protein n=1 Tax=Cerrena zonata TaxID=2478898 RepID=A0AAW0FK96_9APHY